MRSAIDAFNARIAVKLTRSVGTMWCAYIFLILAILGFPLGSTSPTAYVQWVSQTCIQLVMLSVIMVGQDVMSKKQSEHHKEVMTAHAEHGERLEAHHDRLSQIEQHVYGKRLVAKRAKAKEKV
jgi:hypothetical protein